MREQDADNFTRRVRACLSERCIDLESEVTTDRATNSEGPSELFGVQCRELSIGAAIHPQGVPMTLNLLHGVIRLKGGVGVAMITVLNKMRHIVAPLRKGHSIVE